MFRIRDIEPLTTSGNYVYSIQYRDEEGHPHARESYDYHEDIHREVESIFILLDYTEDGLPQIAYLVKMGDDDVHYEPDLVIPVKLLDFIEHMETNSEEDIEIDCPGTTELESFVTHFELKADPERKHPPEIVLKTDQVFMQIKIPTCYE